jgi:hypothetical protein
MVDKPFIGSIGSGPFETTDHLGRDKRLWKTFSCRHCGGVLLVATKGSAGLTTEVYPSGAEELDPSIPERAKDFLQQAQSTLHAPAAALMVCASAIDAMLKTKGYKEGSLYSRIDKAAKDHFITDDMAKWAHQVRLDANEQRHADEEPPIPTQIDARRSLTFALALAQFMFVLPAMVTKGLEESKTTTEKS